MKARVDLDRRGHCFSQALVTMVMNTRDWAHVETIDTRSESFTRPPTLFSLIAPLLGTFYGPSFQSFLTPLLSPTIRLQVQIQSLT